MNVVFVSDNSTEVKRLKNEWNTYVRIPEDGTSKEVKYLPVELRQVSVQQVGISRNGRLQLPENGLFPGDSLVIDAAITGDHTQQAIKDTMKRIPGVSVIVLYDPENESLEREAILAGATNCIARKENYYVRLMQVIEREARYQALCREKAEIFSRENRLRLIVESLPAGIAILAHNGTFLTVNQSGLRLLGFSELGQVVGKNIRELVTVKDKDKIEELLDTIGSGDRGTISIACRGADGKIFDVQLQATTIPKQGIQGSAILAAIHFRTDSPGNEDMQRIRKEYENKLKEQEKSHSIQKTEWEEALDNEQSRRMEAEKKRTSLEVALREAEENLEKAAGDYNADRAIWERIRQQQAHKVQEAEEKQLEVQAALREAGKRLTVIEKALHDSEDEQERPAEQHKIQGVSDRV